MINEFLQYLQYEKNYSSHTVLSYHNDLNQFCSYLNIDTENFQAEAVDATVVQQWVMLLMSEHMSAKSVSRKISTLKSFWRFLLARSYVQKNPTQKIILPKSNKTLPSFFKQKEMERALDETFLTYDFESYRNHLIVEFFYLTGVRLSELISVCETDLELESGSVRVIGKRNKQRIIPISAELSAKIKHYIHIRNECVQVVDPNLFVRENGKKLYPKMVYNLVHEAMMPFSSLEKKSPHVLRHSFATEMLNQGADINAVKELLGHSSLAATQVYTHTSFDELHNIYKHAHPRAK